MDTIRERIQNNLIKSQENYINFLGQHVARLEGMLSTQSWYSTDEKAVEEGKQLRMTINKDKTMLDSISDSRN